VNSYRTFGEATFAELLAAVGGVRGDSAGAVMTSHPRDFTREIVAAIDAVPTLCDHVHLPCSRVDARAGGDESRVHAEWYLERIAWIKAARREISMTSDIIVGFPGRRRRSWRRRRRCWKRLGTMRCSASSTRAAEYSGDCDGGLDCRRRKVAAGYRC